MRATIRTFEKTQEIYKRDGSKEVHEVKIRKATPEELERYFKNVHPIPRGSMGVVLGHGNDAEREEAEAEAEKRRAQLVAAQVVKAAEKITKEDWEKTRQAVEIVGRVNRWK